MANRRAFIRPDISEEEIEEMMDSVEDESDLDYSSDDTVKDPDYEPDEIEIEVNQVIENALNDISALEISASAPSAASSYIVFNNVNLLSDGSTEEVECRILAPVQMLW